MDTQKQQNYVIGWHPDPAAALNATLARLNAEDTLFCENRDNGVVICKKVLNKTKFLNRTWGMWVDYEVVHHDNISILANQIERVVWDDRAYSRRKSETSTRKHLGKEICEFLGRDVWVEVKDGEIQFSTTSSKNNGDGWGYFSVEYSKTPPAKR